jgi:hypothetical protein
LPAELSRGSTGKVKRVRGIVADALSRLGH